MKDRNLNKRLNDFLDKAYKKYKGYYSYPNIQLEYKDRNSIVTICCPKHGCFTQRARKHLEGRIPCPECVKDKIKSTTDHKTFSWFLNEARNVHGNKYEYDASSYNQNQDHKMRIYCSKHGWFEQSERVHLKGHGCPACSNCKPHTTESFILKAKEIHGDKYRYDKTVYGKNNRDLVIITCVKHGDFSISPHDHLCGDGGCIECAYEKTGILHKKTTDLFVKDAKLVHGDKYDYSKVEYVNSKTQVCIVCQTHGDFWQKPQDHLAGCGCQKCGLKMQNKIFSFIENSFPQEQWSWEFSPEWLGKQRFDIYCNTLNFAIEYNGIQHYKVVEHFGGETAFYKRLKLDALKEKLCNDNDCILYVIKYDSVNYDKIKEDINNIITNLKTNSYEN